MINLNSDYLGLLVRHLLILFMILVISPKISLKVEDDQTARKKGETDMNIFYIIGVIVVVLFILGYFGFR